MKKIMMASFLSLLVIGCSSPTDEFLELTKSKVSNGIKIDSLSFGSGCREEEDTYYCDLNLSGTVVEDTYAKTSNNDKQFSIAGKQILKKVLSAGDSVNINETVQFYLVDEEKYYLYAESKPAALETFTLDEAKSREINDYVVIGTDEYQSLVNQQNREFFGDFEGEWQCGKINKSYFLQEEVTWENVFRSMGMLARVGESYVKVTEDGQLTARLSSGKVNYKEDRVLDFSGKTKYNKRSGYPIIQAEIGRNSPMWKRGFETVYIENNRGTLKLNVGVSLKKRNSNGSFTEVLGTILSCNLVAI